MSLRKRTVPAPPYTFVDYWTCDTCGKKMENTPIYTLIGHYGSEHDMQQHHFCSTPCIGKWAHEQH